MLLLYKLRFVRVELCFSPSANAWQQTRSADYVVISSKMLWNSQSQRLLPCSTHTSAHTHISYGLQWNEKNKRKFTQIWMIDLAHLSTNPLCSLPFTHFTISPSTSSVWIHIFLPPLSWLVPQDPHHPHQTPSLSPGITNVVAKQIQVCQGRVVLQSFCQCLTANKDVQNTWWNHLRFFEIYIKEISTPSTACFSYFLWCSHIMWYPMKWKEQAQIHSDLHDGLGTSPILCVVFLSLISPFHRRLALSGSIFSYLPSHDWFLRILTILTKHQAWAPVSPTLLSNKFRFVRVELCFSPSANAWQQTRSADYVVISSKMLWNSQSQRLLPCSTHTSAHTHISCGLQWNKRTSSNSLRSE